MKTRKLFALLLAMIMAIGLMTAVAIADEGPAGTIAIGVVTDDAAVQGDSYINFELSNLNARESIKIKVYSDDILLSTTELVKTDYLSYSKLSANVEITRESSSWETTWAVDPISNLVPDKAELYVDSTLVSTVNQINMYNTDNPANAREWKDIEGVAAAPEGDKPYGYISSTSIWGETWSNATKSYVIKVYAEDNTLMGTTALNPELYTFNGNAAPTWHISFDIESDTDTYWIQEWIVEPSLTVQPAKVELWVDGVKVNEGPVQLNGPDNLNKIVAITADADGKILGYYTNLKNALTAAQSGNTIKVMENVTIDGTITLNGVSLDAGENKITNNGTILVSGECDIAAKVTGDGWVYMNGVTMGDDTNLSGAKVGFINGTNNIVGSTIDDGWFSVGIGQNAAAEAAATFAATNGITLGNVTVNVSDDAVIGGNGATYSGWVGSAYSADKTQHKYELNIEKSQATFGYLHVSADGTLNVTGETSANNKYKYDGAVVDFYAGDFIVNGIATFDGTDAWVKYTKVSVDSATGILNIQGGTNYEASIHNGATTGATLKYWQKGTVNINGATVEIDNETIIATDAELNVTDATITAKGAVTNNGAINVSGTSDIAATVSGDGWVYMNGVTMSDKTELLGAKVRFASGTNIVDGSTINDGFFQVGIGAYEGVDANVDTTNGVIVNVKNNAKIGSKDVAYGGWIGSGFYDTDTDKAAAMTSAKYVLNIDESIAEFGYLHVSNDGVLNVTGNAANKAHYNNSEYSFRGGDFIINGTVTFDSTDVLALYTKVSCDNGTDKPGTLNIVNGTEYEAERHNGAIDGTNFILYKTGVVNVDNAELYVGEYSSIAADAKLNVTDGTVTVLGTVTNNGTIAMDAASKITVADIEGNGKVTINATDFTGTKTVIDIDNDQTTLTNNKLTVTGSDYKRSNGDVILVNVENVKDNTIYVNADWSSQSDIDAILGQSTGYIYGQNVFNTLKDAFAKAVAGDTIVLLSNVTLTETITIEEAIILNGNGKTITGTDEDIFEIKANVTINGVTVVAGKYNYALNFRAGGLTAELNDCNITGAFKGYGYSVWNIKSGTYQKGDSYFSDTLNGTAVVSGGTFHYEIDAEDCAPGYNVVDNGNGTYTVKYAPACFIDTDNDGVLDDGEIVYGNLDQVFANHKEGTVHVVLTADIVANGQVDTDADATYNFTTNVEGGVKMDFLYAENWNYVQKMSIGENITLNAPYLLVWTDLDVSGTVNADYAYFQGADVTIAETGALNVTTGDATVQVKNNAKLTVNGALSTKTLNVWVNDAALIVSGENAKVEADWIDIWDGTPTVTIENGATLTTDAIKASRGGSIAVDGATLNTSGLELGHNGDSKGELTITNNGAIVGEAKLTALESTLTGPEGMNVTSGVDGYTVVYSEGVYALAPGYTVTFNSNDGSAVASQGVVTGGTATQPTAPTKSGYIFAGWYTDEALTTAYDFGTVVTSDITLYAKWTAIPVSSGSSSSSSGSYAVITEKAENGTIKVSPSRADAGDTVTITVTPDKGYELDTLTVTDKNGDEVKVTKKNGKYTFEMPKGKVTVEATFAEIEEDLPFTDVADDFWAVDEIAWAYEEGLMNGNSATTFNPNGLVTRQQVWMILARMSGYAPEDMAAAKGWAISNGVSDGSNPGNPVTRQQLVVLIWRAAGEPEGDISILENYPDADSVADYAKEAMAWAIENGVIGGTAQGALNPAGNANRAQLAVILYRYVG